MKIKKDFILREIAGEWLVIPRGANAMNFSATIILNDAAALLFKMMKDECTEDALVEALKEEYEVTDETARNDVREYIQNMSENKILEG